jgi:hypothetical protein
VTAPFESPAFNVVSKIEEVLSIFFEMNIRIMDLQDNRLLPGSGRSS